MEDTVATIIIDTVLIIGLIAVIIFAVKCSHNQDLQTWNNGYCECGGHYEYGQAVGHAYRTSYIYKCDKCGKVVEFYKVMDESEVTEND